MGPKLLDQVCFALYSTSGQITRAYRALLEPHKLTYPQFVVMMALWEQDAVSATLLAKKVGVSKPTMTPLLKRLEAHGYVARKSLEGDDRQKCIQLTPKGKSLAKQGEEIAKNALCATGLKSNEADQIIALCAKIKSKLSD